MPIKIKVSDLLGKHKMTNKELAMLTGIRPNTITNLYYEEAKRIEFKQMAELCKVFNCKIEDIFEYIEEE